MKYKLSKLPVVAPSLQTLFLINQETSQRKIPYLFGQQLHLVNLLFQLVGQLGQMCVLLTLLFFCNVMYFHVMLCEGHRVEWH